MEPVKLIVADDHVVLRQALCEMLQGGGKFSVVAQASDGEELLRLIQANPADVLVVDVEMPNMDGIKALEHLRNNNSTVPVLVFSADESPSNVRAALQAGARGFLPKNAKADELEFAINSVLRGNTYLSPSVTKALMQPDGTPSASGANSLSVLTKREVEILKYLADGKPNRVIGKMLHISTRTVDTHRSNILKKLNVKTNAELVKIAIQAKLITI
jgi:DNA-binding NarL/FixJ family response regulator